MGIISSNKTIGTVSEIDCQGFLDVTIGITAAPDINTNPTDIVLILDRSGSMNGQPLDDLKTAVNTFVEIIANATAGPPNEIGSGSRIGIVSFSDIAVEDTQLITSVPDLDAAADALVAGGFTNHGDAFEVASAMLSTSTNSRVMIMFTDGVTTVGPDPTPIADAAKAAGITIYCIGLNGNSGVDENILGSWASAPASTHVAIAPDSSQLDQLFANLAANITVPGATNIVIDEMLNPDFTIIGTPVASAGTITPQSDTSFEWSIDQLGTTQTESATVTFTIQHTALTAGTKLVNESITYADTEGNVVQFPDPSVVVNCAPTPINADLCPVPLDVDVTGCEDFVIFDAGDLALEDTGRILQLDINLQNVCPNRRVALAVVLTELDVNGLPQPRGMKTFTVPAHTLPECSDVLVTCIRFILPDNGTTLCADRSVQARFMAHYIDNDFACCPQLVTTP